MSNLYGSPSVKNKNLDRTVIRGVATTAGRPKDAASSNIGSLTCYVNSGDNWPKSDVSPENFNVSLSKMLLGGQPKAGKPTGGVTALRYDDFWFLFSKEPDKSVTYNSIKGFQDVLVKDSTSYICIGDQKALVTTRGADKAPPQTGFPEVGQYGIESSEGEFCFSVNKSVLFGSNAICDVKVEGKAFSALLFHHKNRLYLSNFDFEPILINDEEATLPSYALESGDTVTINETTVTVRLPDVKLDPYCDKLTDDTLCLLDIESNENNIEKIFLQVSKAFTLGRGSDSDLTIADRSISRKHAQLVVYEDHVLIMDCYSKNGTFINNKKTGKGRARIGDLITFADKKYLLGHYND